VDKNFNANCVFSSKRLFLGLQTPSFLLIITSDIKTEKMLKKLSNRKINDKNVFYDETQ